MTALAVIECGPHTTVQDLGRPGWAHIGIPDAGAMDQEALRVANLLVGNQPNEATVELFFSGGKFRAVDGDLRLALAGAPARLSVDGRRVPHHRSFLLRQGETLTVGRAERGVFMVLAAEGGLDVRHELASRSSDGRAGLGLFGGRGLQPGDTLPAQRQNPRALVDREIDPIMVDDDAPIRIVLGPQDHAFVGAATETFLENAFEVSHSINRMAYRLEGPTIHRQPGYEMVSEGTLPGSVQIPGDGAPLILMRDRQTIGGYPKIASIVGPDLRRVAQRPPGSIVRFEVVTAIEAQAIARRERTQLQKRLAGIRELVSSPAFYDFAALSDNCVDALDDASW